MAAQSELERAMARLTTDLVELIRVAVASAIVDVQASPPARAPRQRAAPAEAPAGRGRRGRRPAAEAGGESELEDRILRTLDAAQGSLSASDIQQRLRAEAGPVRYAIKKLKTAGRLQQEGERRGARYKIGK